MSRECTPIPLAHVVYALAAGGSEVLAWRVAAGLKARGRYTAGLYSVQGSGPLGNVLRAHGIWCRAFTKQTRLDVRLILRMARQFRADRIRLVHTHHLGQLLYGGLAGRLAGARVLHTEHDFFTLSRRRSQRLLRVLSTVADYVTSVTEPVTAFLKDQVGIPVAKLRTIVNGVPVDRFRTAQPLSRSSLGWGEKDVIIGCVARLELEKGHRVLLEAFQQLQRRVPGVRLLLVGDGAQRPILTATANGWNLNGAVQFLGTRNDIPELLATCDIVALPSFHEGLPMALLEAMAAGKPVVATSVGGVPMVVRDGETGLLVAPGDPQAMAEALGILVENDGVRRRLAVNAFDDVQRTFSFDQTLERYEALYSTVLTNAAEAA
jgi:glycosyltransferase involved in cell wall biosynthesis